ncbi:MAG: RidA family protein [Snodgrassella sp.]|nr:RidA family protein [Snodgrassella sp.]
MNKDNLLLLCSTILGDSYRLIFLSGQVPTNEETDITAQTANVLAQINQILTACNSDKQHICEAVIYLADMQGYSGMNQAWEDWIIPGRAPARACVQAVQAKPQWKVEIKITAVQK